MYLLVSLPYVIAQCTVIDYLKSIFPDILHVALMTLVGDIPGCNLSKHHIRTGQSDVGTPGQVNNTGQQNLTFFFGTRGKISNPNRTFNAEFKCVSSFSPSPTVCL